MLTGDVRLRDAAPDDVEAVVALVESAYRGESSRAGWTSEADLLDGQRTDVDEVRSLLEHVLIAENHEGVIGCCTLVPKDSHAHFGMFAVRPGLQGGGVGSALLTEAETRARQLGLHRVEMTVLSLRTELIAFYERRGYRHIGETRPFPHTDERFGRPRRDDLEFVVLVKDF
jgi:N-acetylglutamate synthase-like GNAT family acetyltransferase